MKKIFAFAVMIFVFSLFTACIIDDDTTAEGEQMPVIEYIEPSSEVIEITSFDGYTIRGRLTLPGDEVIDKLVIFVNSSGPHTFDTRRDFGAGAVNHNDFYALRFQEQGIAFFSYNTRGVDLGDTPPLFVTINEEKYLTYLPSNQVRDIYYMINAIKTRDERLANSRVLLLGKSEGAIIAPLVAEKFPDLIDGLFLTGVPIDNMRDVLLWQNSGGASMVWYRNNFDRDGDRRVSREEFEADPNNVVASVLQNATFEQIDVNVDGYIDEQDFYVMLADTRNAILDAIERRDDEWIRNNYGGGFIPLTSGWFLEHFELPSNMELLPALDLPIFIFHGALDQNCDVYRVYALKDRLAELNRTNIEIHTFDGHDHELNIARYIFLGTMPEGLQAMFDAIFNF